MGADGTRDPPWIFAEGGLEDRSHLRCEHIEGLRDLSTRLPGNLGTLRDRVHRNGELHHLRCDQQGLVLPPGLCSSSGERQLSGAFQAIADIRQELLGESDPKPPDLEAMESA
ncbi:MAG TPA: hypothetical protein VFA20_35360 [Myxococcaceae bacterium]|nr:hypothetical protein [Myxococcaceae bacterium]